MCMHACQALKFFREWSRLASLLATNPKMNQANNQFPNAGMCDRTCQQVREGSASGLENVAEVKQMSLLPVVRPPPIHLCITFIFALKK